MPGSPRTLRALALLLAAALVGCGDPPAVPGPKQAPPAGPAAPSASEGEASAALPRRATYDVVPVGEDWGAIEGTVRLTRALTPSRVRATRGEDVTWREGDSDRLRYDAEHLTLGQALVFLREIPRGKDWPEGMRGEDRTLTITLRDGFLVPHVAWVRRGTGLELVNGSAKMECALKVWAQELVGLRHDTLLANVMLAQGARVRPTDELRLKRAGPNLILPDI